MNINYPTREELNIFTADTVAAMTADERANWETLSDLERKSIAYSAWIALNN